MKPFAPPIGIAETPRGLVVSLPPRFWLLVSLRRHFRLAAEPEAWTYRLLGANLARRLETWIAAVELQLAAERRRRAWSATDAEWDGVAAPAPASAAIDGEAFAAEIAAAARPGVARPVLRLLEAMRAGEVLTVAVADGGRAYRLSPSGRPVRASLAERAIGQGLLVPSCDGLFGPEWSQTWRAPPAAEASDAATNGGGAAGPEGDPAGAARGAPPVRRAGARRPGGEERGRKTGARLPDGRRRARVGGGVA